MADRYTAADIEAALRTMADERGRSAGGPAPVSVGWWTAHRDPARHPTSARVIQRYGTWNDACRAAGIPVVERARSGRTARWDAAACTGWVRAFLASDAPGRSYVDFDRWLQGQPDGPSAQTVRNTLGSWSQALERAGS